MNSADSDQPVVKKDFVRKPYNKNFVDRKSNGDNTFKPYNKNLGGRHIPLLKTNIQINKTESI